ncbi:hypothetical protein TNCV_1070161 [Trichonephila clavipes]|nr:hypothetical protein TNCV_1070161 [Trichonephila clavipes]
MAAVAEWYRYRTVACFVTARKSTKAKENAGLSWKDENRGLSTVDLPEKFLYPLLQVINMRVTMTDLNHDQVTERQP